MRACTIDILRFRLKKVFLHETKIPIKLAAMAGMIKNSNIHTSKRKVTSNLKSKHADELFIILNSIQNENFYFWKFYCNFCIFQIWQDKNCFIFGHYKSFTIATPSLFHYGIIKKILLNLTDKIIKLLIWQPWRILNFFAHILIGIKLKTSKIQN